jgi:hypothetical protein
MVSPIDELFCSACSGYVHPFLEACPGCATPRQPRYDAAVAEPDQGLRRLLEDPQLRVSVGEVVLRYTLKFGGSAFSGQIRDGMAKVFGALAYAVSGVGTRAATSRAAVLELAADDLVVRESSPRREVARLPLETILAVRAAARDGAGAGKWTGLAAFGTLHEETIVGLDGDLVITYAAGAGAGRLALANRRGIFVARARRDHYTIVARWLGILAAAAAEARWVVVGPARYAAELGLVPPTADAAGALAEPGPAAGHYLLRPSQPPVPGRDSTPSAAARSSVADSLAALEELRARGLVSEAEYAAKRSEILARL